MQLFEVFELNKNLIINPDYLIIFIKKDNFFDKLSYYGSFENFLVKESIQQGANNNNIIYLSKEAGKIFGFMEKLFEFNSNNLKENIKPYNDNQKYIIQKLTKEIFDLKLVIDNSKKE